MSFGIHIKPSRPKLSYSQMMEGDGGTRGRGMTIKDKELAIRDHIQGCSRQERTDIYKQFFLFI